MSRLGPKTLSSALVLQLTLSWNLGPQNQPLDGEAQGVGLTSGYTSVILDQTRYFKKVN